MRFSCEGCGAHYMISDEKVGPNGVKVRCKKCSRVIVVRRPPPEPEPEVAAPPPPAPEASQRSDGLDEELGQAFDKVMAGSGTATEAAAAAAAAASEPEPPPEPPPPAPESPAPEALAPEWYVAIDDQQVGPMAAEGVKSRWESGEIGPDTLVWCAGQADWEPLSSVVALARYLAPVPRGERPARAPEPAPAPPAAEPPAEERRPAEPEGWKPAAASALAALASEELRSVAPTAASPPGAGAGSLIESMNLPDTGGVDPTGVIPLPMKGLDASEEKAPKRESSVARTTAEVRLKRSTNRIIVLSAAAVVLLVCGAASGLWWYFEHKEEREVAALAAAKPVPPPVSPSPTPAAAAPAVPAPPSPPPSPPPAPEAAAAAPAALPAPAPAEAAPAAKPVEEAPAPPVRAASSKQSKRKGKGEPSSRRSERVAVASAPAPAASHKTGDPLLDASDVDADFERELSGGAKPKRSVYVPPATGSDLPDRLTEAQINEGVASRIDALKQCLEQQTAAQPDAHGTLKVRWMIQGDGSVSGVKALTPEFAGQPISGCIAGVVKTIRFPRSRTTGQEVVFPFRF